ncbi:MAG TPA: hypothetical protein VN690_03870 [Terriglobales bacterium]|nr:hypothetical protein [Terriglobales bacterium]
MNRLSRAHRWSGPLTWYMAEDHLLAADQVGFTVRYRRVFYSDLRTVVIWPDQKLGARLGIEALVTLLSALPALLLPSRWPAALLLAIGLVWMLADWAQGPNATARIESVHSAIQGPLAPRWRNAEAILSALQLRLQQTSPATAVREPVAAEGPSNEG